MIWHAGLPSTFWDFVVFTTGYLYNRNPTQIMYGKSPLEAMFGKTPEYHKLRIFGSKCFPCLRPYKSDNLSEKLCLCIFVGYPISQDGYLCFDSVDQQIYASWDVTFIEGDFSLNSSLF